MTRSRSEEDWFSCVDEDLRARGVTKAEARRVLGAGNRYERGEWVMAKVKYKDVNFRADSRDIIAQCNQIIDAYVSAGYRLTLRQLYYQLVTVNAITNEEKSYKRLSGLLTDARYAGLVDWEAIEDRVRQPRAVSDWNDLQGDVEEACAWIRKQGLA